MFNTDRGLMDPTNGLLMDEINLNNPTEGPQLKENRDQQYYEGNDVFANFQLPNTENEKRFIQQVQNTNNETKKLDSTLFSQDRIDNDIVNRMIIEDINNPYIIPWDSPKDTIEYGMNMTDKPQPNIYIAKEHTYIIEKEK